MIAAKDAIRTARSLLGTPYAELDCVNFIKRVIRTAPGGVKDYTTAGTNTLWRSIDAAEKYRDLTFRQEGLLGARAGMLAFKADGADVHHVGLVTGEKTVIHSSSTKGGRGVVETPLTSREGWTHLAEHRYIETSSVSPDGAATFPKGEGLLTEKREESKMTDKQAVVTTAGGKLNVRQTPEGRIIGSLENGSEIEITGSEGDWLRIHFGEERSGYVFAAYVSRKAKKKQRLRITDEAGDIYDIEGAFTVRVIED